MKALNRTPKSGLKIASLFFIGMVAGFTLYSLINFVF